MTERPTTDDRTTSIDRSAGTDGALRAELYLRGDAHAGLGVQEVVNRANRLEANGVLSESMVAGTWHRCHTQAEDWRSEAMETYEEFRAWAEANDFSLEPGFQQRSRSFIGMDDVEEVVVFPAIALALYGAGDLVAVFPCTDDDRTYTVERALAAFEHDDQSWLTQFEPLVTDRPGPRLEPEVTMN